MNLKFAGALQDESLSTSNPAFTPDNTFTKLRLLKKALQPKVVVAIREIEKLPATLYVWSAMLSFENVPSPKSHCRFLISPDLGMDKSVKRIANGKQPIESDNLNLISGRLYTVM